MLGVIVTFARTALNLSTGILSGAMFAECMAGAAALTPDLKVDADVDVSG